MGERTIVPTLILLLALALALSGCIDDDGPGEKDELKYLDVEVGDDPISLLGGKVLLEVPPSARPFRLGFTEMSDPPKDQGLVEGSAVTISPDKDLNVTCRITMSYDPTTLPNDVDEESLMIAKVVEDFWAVVGTSIVDGANDSVSATIGHFSSFSLLYPKGPRIGPAHSRVLPGQSVRMRVFQDPLSGGTLEYKWNCTNNIGHMDHWNMPGRYMTYYSDQDKEGKDEMTVEVFEKVGDKKISLGKAHALIEVRYTELLMTPSMTQIMHNTNMSFTAYFAPELDDTVSVRIRWTCTAKNGLITDLLSTPSSGLLTPVKTIVYKAGDRGGFWDKIEAQVNIDMGSGMGGYHENALTLGMSEADIFVFDIAPSGSIPHRDYWGNTRGNVSLSTYHPKPGEKVSVTVTWNGGPEDEMVLYCARAVSVSGSFKSGPLDLDHPSLGGMHKGGPDELDCTAAGMSVIISNDRKSVVFEIDGNISRSELIHTWTPNTCGGTTFHGPAVILWIGGTYAWGSGRMFEIDASGVIPSMPK